MKTVLKGNFTGFTRDSVQFFRDLENNNSRAWFESNRSKYDKLYEEFTMFVLSLNDTMLEIDPDFEIRPSKIISRIYRDLRFSRDKTPFRTCTWITYKRPGTDMNEKPVFFFELSADLCRYGMGFYAATKKALDAYRDEIIKGPDSFTAMVKPLLKNKFNVEGDIYKKKIDNNLPDSLQEWFQRRNLYLIKSSPVDDEIYSVKISKRIQKEFTILAPFYNFLWKTRS